MLSKHAAPDRSAALAAARERLTAKFWQLVDRLEGRDPGPDAAVTERIAALAWHDPEAAAAQLKAYAQGKE